MKFLSKTEDSQILKAGLTYLRNNSTHNSRLRELLVSEQCNFCAYTEKYFQGLDSSEVEHFDSSKKYDDNYYNYYAVIRKANQYKKDAQYVGADFFESRFFQDFEVFYERVTYVQGGTYEEVDEDDNEAAGLIDFLGFNNEQLYNQRVRHIKRLKKSFSDAGYSVEDKIQYFRDHVEDLSFITAIEVELGLDLSEFY